MTARSGILVVLAFAMALFTGSAYANALQIKDTVKQAFEVRQGGTLFLDLDHGNIDVRVGDDDRVVIVMERIADVDSRSGADEMLAHHEYDFDQRGDEIRIRSRFEKGNDGFWGKWRGHNRLKVHVKVEVPERFNVEFTSGAGNIAIRDLEGFVNGRTGAGNVVVKDIDGPVEVNSGAGNIELLGEIEYADINTGAGNIQISGVRGAVKAHTGAGNIQAEITEQPEQASNLKTGAGNVTLYLNEDVSVYVDASASMGSCDTDFPLKVEGKWLSKSFSGRINGGGPEIRMSAGVGNVSLRRN